VLTNYKHLIWPERMGFFSTLSEYVLGGVNIEQANTEEQYSYKFLPITTLYTSEFLNKMDERLLT
jgi:hypothetical protein